VDLTALTSKLDLVISKGPGPNPQLTPHL